jgi:preprotein translocase subunit YajC
MYIIILMITNNKNLPINLEDIMVHSLKKTQYINNSSHSSILIIICVLLFFCISGFLWLFIIKPMINQHIIKNLKISNQVAINGIVGIIRHIEPHIIIIDTNNHHNLSFLQSDIYSIKHIVNKK